MGRYKLFSESSFDVLFLCLGFYSYVAVGGSGEGKGWSYGTQGKEKWYRKQLVDGGSTGSGLGPILGKTGSVTQGGLNENGDAAFGTVVGPGGSVGPGGPALPGGAVGNNGAAGAGSGTGTGIGAGIGQCGKDYRGNKHCIPSVGGGGVGGETGGYASGVGGAGGFGNSGVYGSGGGGTGVSYGSGGGSRGVSYGSGGGGGLGYGFSANKGGNFGNIGGYGSGIRYGGGYGSGGRGGYGGSHGKARETNYLDHSTKS